MWLLLTLLAGSNAQASGYFCTEYEPRSTRCNVCLASYRTNAGVCVPPSMIIPNCMMYATPTACAACVFGYGLVDNHCLPLASSDPCLFYVRGNCAMCRANVLLTPSGCQPSMGCAGLSYCDYCGMNSALIYCQRCASGYANVINTVTGTTTCVRARGPLANCWSSLNGATCFSCQVNYYIFGELCYPSPAYHFDADWLAPLPA